MEGCNLATNKHKAAKRAKEDQETSGNRKKPVEEVGPVPALRELDAKLTTYSREKTGPII
jgi:hypothetical protein